MSDRATVLASYARLKTLSDGTLQLTLNVEPKDAPTAFAMCDKPGASIVLARITDEAAVAADTATASEGQDNRGEIATPPAGNGAEPHAEHHRKPLSLASKVAMTCQSPTFINWLRHEQADLWDAARAREWERQQRSPLSVDVAAEAVREFCGVKSRSEITEGSESASHWHTLEAEYELAQRDAA